MKPFFGRAAISVTLLLAATPAQGAPTLYEMAESPGRPANAYRISESFDDPICDLVLADLNKGYPMPRGYRMPSDYAMIEYYYYLGTPSGIGWTIDEIQLPGGTTGVEVAGRFIRFFGSLASVLRHSIYVRDERPPPARDRVIYSSDNAIRFSIRNLTQEWDAKGTYSLKNIILLDDRHLALLKPMIGDTDQTSIYVFELTGGRTSSHSCTMILD